LIAFDRWQYMTGWPSGYALTHVVAYLHRQEAHGPLTVISSMYNPPGDALIVLVGHERNITLTGPELNITLSPLPPCPHDARTSQTPPADALAVLVGRDKGEAEGRITHGSQVQLPHLELGPIVGASGVAQRQARGTEGHKVGAQVTVVWKSADADSNPEEKHKQDQR